MVWALPGFRKLKKVVPISANRYRFYWFSDTLKPILSFQTKKTGFFSVKTFPTFDKRRLFFFENNPLSNPIEINENLWKKNQKTTKNLEFPKYPKEFER